MRGRRTIIGDIPGDAGFPENAAEVANGASQASTLSSSGGESIEAIAGRLAPIVCNKIDHGEALRMSRGNLAFRISDLLGEICQREGILLSEADGRHVVTLLINHTLSEAKRVLQGGGAAAGAGTSDRIIIDKTKQRIQPILLDRIDVSKAVNLPPGSLPSRSAKSSARFLRKRSCSSTPPSSGTWSRRC